MADLVSISERIASLSDTHKECMTLITRLSKLSTPGTDAARTELAQHIHQILREAETEHELLVDEASSSTANTAIAPLLSKTGEDLKIARQQYRRALLSAKHNSHAAERDLLLSHRRKGGGGGGGGNEKVSSNDVLVSASTDVTAALRRTQQLLSAELSRSTFASETLAASSEALRDLGERYHAFDDVLSRSKVLIRDLVRKNKSDRWYYEKAIQILLATLVWIILRRLFWGPLWLLVVWPLKTTWWVCASVVGLGRTAETAVEVGTQTPGRAVIMQSPVVVVNGEKVPEAVAKEREAKEEGNTMIEVVANIIDGGSTTIMRNTKSRRFEEPPEETVRAAVEEVEPEPEPKPEPKPEPQPAAVADVEEAQSETIHDEL